MDIIVHGKNLELTEPIKAYATRKLARLGRYWPEINRIDVTLAVTSTRASESRAEAEASVLVGGIVLHATEQASDLYAAIDLLAEKLERQVRRKKGQLAERTGPAIWPEPSQAGTTPPLQLLRATDEAAAGLTSFGEVPNPLGWSVIGPQGKPVGEVTGIYIHPDLNEIVGLIVTSERREFTVPIAEVTIKSDQEVVQLRRNLDQIPPPPAELRGRETPLRQFLANYGIAESTIDRLEAAGIRTMRDLRVRVEDGRLEALLGETHRAEIRELERLIEEQR